MNTTSHAQIYDRLGITSTDLEEFCQRWRVAELSLFGSVLRNDFTKNSDVDVLVAYLPTAQRGLFEKNQMKEELEGLLHRKVDLVSKQAIAQSRNWLRRRNILDWRRLSMLRDQEALVDILEAIKLILQYAEGQDFEMLAANIEKQDAILRRITIIGEATKRLSNEFRARYPEVPWKQMAGMRDVVTHDYDEVDLEDVWAVVQRDLPQLLADIEPLVSPEQS